MSNRYMRNARTTSRKIHILFLLLLCWILMPQYGYSCGNEYPTHNYYMASFVETLEDAGPYRPDLDTFWTNYSQGKYKEYPRYDVTGLQVYIKSIGDDEMLSYVRDLNTYLDICDEFYTNSWDYPDKEDYEIRDSLILSVQTHAKNYKGSRLSGQYNLLYMRCLMLLRKWDEVKQYWETTGKRMVRSVYRDMMENIYAGALFHTGSIEEPLEIFSRQGDGGSLRCIINKYYNLAGIRRIYSRNPNSPVLPYLLQVYVNNFQETYDNKDVIDTWDEEKETVEKKDILAELHKESSAFCSFVDSVLEIGQVNDPCMWGTAQSLVYFINGDKDHAKTSIIHAMSLPGSSRVKDNCRCANLLIQSSDSCIDRNWLVGELQWLDSQCQNEQRDGYCYSNALDRILVKTLSPMLQSHGEDNLSLAVLAMYNEMEVQHSTSHHRSPNYDYEMHGESTWNWDYQNEFMVRHFYHQSATSSLSYYEYITSDHNDPLSRYVCSRVYKDKDFFYDFIGTKYLAEARFKDAIPYFEQVSLSYLGKQNISYYMKHRDFHKERWIERQARKDDYEHEGMRKIVFDHNPKLQFCRDILNLQKSYSKYSQSEKGNQIAYKLAILNYQASPKGDCWWLTSYRNSSSPYMLDQWHVGENDFIKSSEVYLRSCLDTEDPELLGKCLYALAYTATDDWLNYPADDSDQVSTEDLPPVPNPLSEKYMNLDKLNEYYEQQKTKAPAYMSKCDVLKQFRKMKWMMEY